jgi:carboxynorspermidine decarboxylase
MNRAIFVLEKEKLQANLAHFSYLAKQTGIVWLYTLKAFDAPEGLEMIANVFEGFSIGNANEHSKVETYATHLHSYAPAFYDDEVQSLARQSHTMSFNSLSQWQRYAKASQQYTSLGLRINPQLSLEQPRYCDSNLSRLGVPYEAFLDAYAQLEKLEGLHFHALCHQSLPALKKLLSHIETHYQSLLPQLKWLNLGGGQNFTHKGYDTLGFIEAIQNFQAKYPHLTLYFEPASAVVYGCGYLECQILDILPSTPPTAILNTSIETDLLDVAITKHPPKVKATSTKGYTYVLAGMSCIAGDVIGEYQFKEKLTIGQKIVFEDMLGYSLVKQTTFNGLKVASFCVK